MHEFSVTQSLVELCNKEAKANHLKIVNKINIKLGRFTGFSSEAIRFYFDYLKPGTRCESAKLSFDEIQILVRCRDCDYKGIIDEPIFYCPKCSKGNLEILKGREFYVESIEGETQ